MLKKLFQYTFLNAWNACTMYVYIFYGNKYNIISTILKKSN